MQMLNRLDDPEDQSTPTHASWRTDLLGHEPPEISCSSSRADSGHCQGFSVRGVSQQFRSEAPDASRGLLCQHAPISKGSRCLGVRQQEPCSGETAAATLDAHMLGQLRPAPKLNSVPSFSSSASTLDQLLSLSPLSTEAHSALFQRPNDYVHKTSYPPLGHNWLSATGAGVSYGTASTSSAQQQPAATQAWQTCDASFPQEMDDLLDWAASEGMQDGVPMGVSNASDQALDLHLQSSMPEVPCYSFEDLAVDIPSDASNNVPPELCDMYAALEQHCALSNCHTQTGSDVLPTLDNLAQQDMMSALTQKQTPTTSDQQMPKTLHTDIYCLDSTAQTTAPVPLQQISEADPNILRASSTASYGLQLLFAATADQTHDQVLDCLQFPEEPSWLQLDECHQQQAAHSNGLQLGCTASSTQMQEGCTASSYPLHLGYTAASAHLHEADYNSNSVSGTPLQTGCPASSSPCLQTDHNTCQQADYNSGTGSGSGDCNAGCERPGGDVALAEEAAVRKRKGGRPRVYDLDRPIPSDAALVCTPKPRGRGAKPKYVYDTPEEAVAKRRKRNRDTANNSYAKRKERVMCLKQQIKGLQEEGAVLANLVQLLQQLPPADHGWVQGQLQSGQPPGSVASAVLQKLAAKEQNNAC